MINENQCWLLLHKMVIWLLILPTVKPFTMVWCYTSSHWTVVFSCLNKSPALVFFWGRTILHSFDTIFQISFRKYDARKKLFKTSFLVLTLVFNLSSSLSLFLLALSTVAPISPSARRAPFRPASTRRRRKHRKRISKAAIRAMIM